MSNTKNPQEPTTAIDKIIDWQLRLSIRESVLQDVSANKTIHFTGNMLTEAREDAKKALLTLIANEKKELLDRLTKQAFENAKDDMSDGWLSLADLEAERTNLGITLKGDK